MLRAWVARARRESAAWLALAGTGGGGAGGRSGSSSAQLPLPPCHAGAGALVSNEYTRGAYRNAHRNGIARSPLCYGKAGC